MTTTPSPIEEELAAATERILQSNARKKLVVAGPGTGKTYLFKKLLEQRKGNQDRRLVLTFINALTDDLAEGLEGLAKARTLHGFCFSMLKRKAALRRGLSENFVLQPRLASLIKVDWTYLQAENAPRFVDKIRNLEEDDLDFYLARANYYDAVDYDECVYRVFRGFREHPEIIETWELLLVDEFQDFNGVEAAVVLQLAEKSETVVVGDDDQALYSQLRGASWEAVRRLHAEDDFESFELPFCMRCTKVIVKAIEDIVTNAHANGKLQGRIKKPYRFFPPKKGDDSAKYPHLEVVTTSVQSKRVNYWGRYVAQELAKIPPEEIAEAAADGDPTVLIIGPRHYLAAIGEYLENEGFSIEASRGTGQSFDLDAGLKRLKADPESNLGWRIVLYFQEESFASSMVTKAAENNHRLVDVIPDEFRREVLATADELDESEESPEDRSDIREGLSAKLVTFESSKGLSAQHVFIVGLHDGDLPRNPSDPQDIEICRLLVALTRARKKCTFLCTERFAGTQKKTRSSFFGWINPDRIVATRVTKHYWT